MRMLYKGNLYESVGEVLTAYHVTYLRSIESILNEGLTPGSKGGIGIGAYSSWSNGKLFFSTCQSDLSFWLSRYEDHAADRSDDFVEDLMIPVVLRFEIDNYEIDTMGQNEGRQCSFYTIQKIPPEDLEVFYNGTWSWLDEANLDPNLAVDPDGYLQDSVYTPRSL
jgi:hypothetical protein